MCEQTTHQYQYVRRIWTTTVKLLLLLLGGSRARVQNSVARARATRLQRQLSDTAVRHRLKAFGAARPAAGHVE